MASNPPVTTPPAARTAAVRQWGRAQRGGFVMGLIVGLVIGLALALGVALYVTKAPVPFVNKVPQRSAEQDAAEAQRNKNWDPNAPLASKVPRPVTPGAEAASGAAAGGSAPVAGTPAASAPTSARNPAAILAGQAPAPAAAPGPASAPANAKAGKAAPGAETFTYFVQAGAFQRTEDAEAQRVKLTMLGLEPRVLEREQAGRTVYRVRVGPFDKQAEAEALRDKLASTGMEAALVRIERPAQ